MLKYLIYLVTMFIIIYFQFVGTDMQKKSDLKIVQEYLSIPVPIDTINTANQFRLGDSSFVIWSDLYGHKKNIEFTKEQLKKMDGNYGWELEKTNKYNTSNVNYFKKNNLYYKVFNSLKTNEWSEDIGYKK